MKSDKAAKKSERSSFCPVFGLHEPVDISGLIMEAKMEKDADSMVVKPVEYAGSEYSASSEPPPVSSRTCFEMNVEQKVVKHENAIKIRYEDDGVKSTSSSFTMRHDGSSPKKHAFKTTCQKVIGFFEDILLLAKSSQLQHLAISRPPFRQKQKQWASCRNPRDCFHSASSRRTRFSFESLNVWANDSRMRFSFFLRLSAAHQVAH